MALPENFRDTATQFGAVARRYCALVDSSVELEKDQFLLQMYRVLPDLLVEAVRLPDTDPWKRNEEEDGSDDFPAKDASAEMSHEEWSALYNLLKEKLGQDDFYWTVFDPTSEDNEVIRGTLADDLADVYRDVKESLLLVDKNAMTAELAIWNWRLLFYSHWGDHAISALRAIHNLLDEKIEDGDLS
jgi:Domain of unknown function (DUF5063)